MRNFLNPKWLLIINIFPSSLLLLIFNGEYQIINSLLNEHSKWLWAVFGYTLAALTVLNLCYTIFMIRKNKNVSYLYGVIAILSYIPYLYMYSMNTNKLLPFTIPQWMLSDNILLYVGTFLMPTLVYSLFILVIKFTPNKKDQSAWKNFAIVILIPCMWYIFTQLILPFWKPINSNFSQHAIILFIIITTLVFLFFLIRGVFILGLKKSNILNKYQLFWKVSISIIFPLLGLALNNGHLTDITFGVSGIFGDFSHYWFYILAILNGLFICLPNFEQKEYRLFLFAARSLTFTYTLYFFLVFLPFLPLSVLAIIAVGTGFLMLTPLVLFIVHINELINDYRFLKINHSTKITSLTLITGILVIPLFVTLSNINDRNVLNVSLDYLYTPDYSKNYNIEKSSLSKTLEIIKTHKEKNRNSLFGNKTPYLTSFFSWIVLDNLTLSNAKIATIENVFFGEHKAKQQFNRTQSTDVKISKIKSRSRYDKDKNAWVSWIDLELTNKSSVNGFAEYASTLDLPTGVWISDYYLYVGKKKEMGILAEKKSAMFIYSQIRNERKDPGILYYLTANKVAFRVFPFSSKEIRKTGIEFIHNRPVTLKIDNRTVKLGNSKNKLIKDVIRKKHNDVIYVSSEEKSKLSKTSRKPYYHFIVDISKEKNKNKGDFISRIDELFNKNLISRKNAKISFVNTYSSSFEMDANWKQRYTEQRFDGGFYLDRAIKKALFASYKKNEDAYPVIVVVTDAIENSIIKNNFAEFKITYPENNFFYNLNSDSNLIAHSLLESSISPATSFPALKFKHLVLPYPNSLNPIAYLPDTDKPEIVMLNKIVDVKDDELIEKNWNSGILLQGKWISHILHPEIANKEWLSLVRESFITKILTPITSYIVVENEAQKAFLRKKQQEVLASNKYLDLNDDVDNMTEPNIFLLAILVVISLWLKDRRIKFLENKSFPR